MNEITILNTAISTDAEGRFSLNDLHKASGGDKKHQPANFLRMEQTQELISELGDENKLLRCEEFPVDDEKAFLTSEERPGDENKLRTCAQFPVDDEKAFREFPERSGEHVSVVQGGVASAQGTFVAWELVYAYAMWISPKFHLHVIRTFHRLQVEERLRLTSELNRHKSLLSHVSDNNALLREKVEFLDVMVTRSTNKKSGRAKDFLCAAMDRGIRDYRKAVLVPHVKMVDEAVKGARRIVTQQAAWKNIAESVRQAVEDHLCVIEQANVDLLIGQPVGDESAGEVS